jgi:hypothetical protein
MSNADSILRNEIFLSYKYIPFNLGRKYNPALALLVSQYNKIRPGNKDDYCGFLRT